MDGWMEEQRNIINNNKCDTIFSDLLKAQCVTFI